MRVIALVVLTVLLLSAEEIPSSSLCGLDHPDTLMRRHVALDTTESRQAAPPDVKEREGLTRRQYERLNSLRLPKPSGYFVMDGELDTSSVLLGSDGVVQLHAAVRGSQLYVATNSARSQGADMLLFVSTAPGELRGAPLGKAGRVAVWSAFLVQIHADTAARWYDGTCLPLENVADEKAGAVLEGVVDFELLTGMTPSAVYLAVGKYKVGKGGGLVAKLPAGTHDGNISSAEFYKLEIPGTH